MLLVDNMKVKAATVVLALALLVASAAECSAGRWALEPRLNA